MILFSWNCRGIGQASTIRELKALLQSSSPDVLILMETKAKSSTMQLVLSQLQFPNHVYVPPLGLSGGFCVAWREDIDMEPITMNKNLISFLVFFYSGYSTLVALCDLWSYY